MLITTAVINSICSTTATVWKQLHYSTDSQPAWVSEMEWPVLQKGDTVWLVN